MVDNNLAIDLNCFENDLIFFQQNQEFFRKRYLNKFIAIKNKDVICSANSIQEMNNKLKNNGLEPEKTVIEFVPEEEKIMIL